MPLLLASRLDLPLLTALVVGVAFSAGATDAQVAGQAASQSVSRNTREPHRVRVIGTDYALQAPDSARAGLVAFEFENRGTKDHELFVGLLRPGANVADIIAAHQKGLGFRQLQTAYLEGAASGLLFAVPGTRSPASLVMPLSAGRSYLLFCQLRDTVGAPQHAALGMFHVLRVRANP